MIHLVFICFTLPQRHFPDRWRGERSGKGWTFPRTCRANAALTSFSRPLTREQILESQRPVLPQKVTPARLYSFAVQRTCTFSRLPEVRWTPTVTLDQ